MENVKNYLCSTREARYKIDSVRCAIKSTIDDCEQSNRINLTQSPAWVLDKDRVMNVNNLDRVDPLYSSYILSSDISQNYNPDILLN